VIYEIVAASVPIQRSFYRNHGAIENVLMGPRGFLVAADINRLVDHFEQWANIFLHSLGHSEGHLNVSVAAVDDVDVPASSRKN
jgi:hypothetical protein